VTSDISILSILTLENASESGKNKGGSNEILYQCVNFPKIKKI
jgi:hypothetical protein